MRFFLAFSNFKKVGLDQFVAAPTILATFFTVMSLAEGKGIEEAREKLRTVSVLLRLSPRGLSCGRTLD